jgi:hypothetical protein
MLNRHCTAKAYALTFKAQKLKSTNINKQLWHYKTVVWYGRLRLADEPLLSYMALHQLQMLATESTPICCPDTPNQTAV